MAESSHSSITRVMSSSISLRGQEQQVPHHLTLALLHEEFTDLSF